jgi:hypothetical protein
VPAMGITAPDDQLIAAGHAACVGDAWSSVASGIRCKSACGGSGFGE